MAVLSIAHARFVSDVWMIQYLADAFIQKPLTVEVRSGISIVDGYLVRLADVWESNLVPFS